MLSSLALNALIKQWTSYYWLENILYVLVAYLLFILRISQKTTNYRPAGVAKVGNFDANVTRILDRIRSSSL